MCVRTALPHAGERGYEQIKAFLGSEPAQEEHDGTRTNGRMARAEATTWRKVPERLRRDTQAHDPTRTGVAVRFCIALLLLRGKVEQACARYDAAPKHAVIDLFGSPAAPYLIGRQGTERAQDVRHAGLAARIGGGPCRIEVHRVDM